MIEEDVNVELAVRRARMREAVADPLRSTSSAIAAMAAGAGAEMVAQAQRAHEALADRLTRWNAMSPEDRRALVESRLKAMRSDP